MLFHLYEHTFWIVKWFGHSKSVSFNPHYRWVYSLLIIYFNSMEFDVVDILWVSLWSNVKKVALPHLTYRLHTDRPGKSRSKTKNKRKKNRTIITVFGGPFSLGGYRCLIFCFVSAGVRHILNEFIYIGQFHYQFYCFRT